MRAPLITMLTVAILLLTTVAVHAADRKPWKDQTVQLGDIKMHYLEAGSGSRNLVFVPGLMMIAEVWREQIPYFAARGYRVFAIDPRSHGSTTRTELGNTYHQQAADLHAFLRTLKIEDPHLVGWSAGVTVLLGYVASPEAVRPEKLVLVDGSPVGLHSAEHPFGMTMQQARDVLLRLQDNRAKATDELVRGMFRNRQSELLYKELTEGAMKTPLGTVVSLFFDLFTGDRRTNLLRIDSPTLIVVPDSNRLLGDFLQSKIPDSRLEVVEDAGHALFLEKPQTFNQIVEEFLAKP